MRDTDGLWPDGPGGLMLVLVDADGPNSEPALARLRMRLRSEGLARRADGPRGAGAGHRAPATCWPWRATTGAHRARGRSAG